MTPIERADHIDLCKRQVEACFEDYRLGVLSYALWMEGWRERERLKKGAEQ